MAKQDMSELGFRNVDEVGTLPDKKGKLEDNESASAHSETKEKS
jgi:hypothetical protein